MPYWRSLAILFLAVQLHAPPPALLAAAQTDVVHMRLLSAGAAPDPTPSAQAQQPSGQRCHRAVRQQPHNCSFIREQCAGYGDGLVNYVEKYYCAAPSWHSVMLGLLALWLSLLFIWLGVSASEYFSPNISTLAKLLRLPESLAGVTLLALGNGAPDLSSTYSAVRAGSAALAIGQIIGSASFIISVVVCATTLAVPIYKVSKLSYLRELCFFVATVGMVAMIVLFERLTPTMAVCMVALYAAYVLTVVITTYYEEKCLELELELEAEAQHIAHRVGEQPASSIQGQGSPAAANVDEQTRLLWSGTEGPISGTASRRRNTIGGSDIEYEERDLWDLELLRAANPSAKALGDFLQQHRKSLLAAAECSDILEEICVSRSHANSAFRIVPAHHNLPPPGSSIALCAPSIWKHYTMQPWSSRRSATHDSANTQSQPGEGSIFSYWEEQTDQLAPSWRSRLLDTESRPGKKASSLPSSFTGQRVTPAPTQRMLPALEPSAIYLQGRLEPRSSLSSEPNAKLAVPCRRAAGDRSPGSAIVETVLSLHDALSSTSEVSLVGSPTVPSQSMEPGLNRASANYATYSASCQELLGSSGSKFHAVLYTCVPTLRFWLPGAALFLKAFIAFSALPVLALTLTVPVVTFTPHDFGGRVTCDHSGSDDDDHSFRGFPVTGPVCGSGANRDEGQPSRSLTPVHMPTYAATIPVPVVSDAQSIHDEPHSTADRYCCHHQKAMADIEWAEAAVSYARSAASTLFLYGILYYGDYLPLVLSSSVRAAVVAIIAGLSMLANYAMSICPIRRYWKQIVPCLVGFASGLVWVSMVADEIVSITQALGLMLGLSEEIMGLTIVGFGNSLGDLVTNLTLARMGYPMMALSACFGGPMLCLLLGVGVAACGNMTKAGLNGGSFEIPFTSSTVIVSTACLLFNSLLFLVSIPRHGYHMTRAAGLAALTVYLAGMAVNVYIEW
ncbi:hypothetical protein IWW55_001968 [Coemansia sp. RSA 2706]|nr:hypothetical protein IWW55_001968 [Coemansia sp. RSA 2706]